MSSEGPDDAAANVRRVCDPSGQPGVASTLAGDRSGRHRMLLIAIAVFVGALILLIATEWGALVGLRTSSPDSVGASAPPPSSLAPSASTAGGAAGSAAASSALVATSSAPVNPGITGGPTPVRAFGVSPIPPPPPEGARSPLADQLNDPRRTARDDVLAVAEILANYREALDQLPVGTNAEITAALAGDNPRAHTPLPADSAAISPGGELSDRWGTPYFFHQISRDLVEVRSAGPDHKHFTADDVVWPESGLSPGGGNIAQAGQ